MSNPEQSKSCGCATKRTRFTPAVNGGILSLLKDSEGPNAVRVLVTSER